ncbi:FG-GAP-like repeat-containing protein [Saccharicrinis sp. FJH2]|uniref:FG-GAP-like repeat-containing protein n=1 Tax=Saccharicrinis sp. FJH65 TaxID=3344659 RepID=UPI0035F3622B
MKTIIIQLLIITILLFAFENKSFCQSFTLVEGFFPDGDFYDLDWGDLDNDGDLDYVFTKPVYPTTGGISGSNIKVYENKGNGIFSEIVSFNPSSAPHSVAWCDINNDNYLDLIVIDFDLPTNGRGTRFYRNNGDKTFSLISGLRLTPEYDGNLALGDFNNDRYKDIIYNGHAAGGENKSNTYLYKNTGNETFTQISNHNIIGVCYSSMDWGDFDGDGFLDLLISGLDLDTGEKHTKVYKNNGNETFSELLYNFTGAQNSGGLRGTCSAWGDIDNDNDLDIVQVFDGKIYLYKNTGQGSFYANYDSIIVSEIYKGSLSIGDYDNDNDLDILVAGSNTSSSITKVFSNNGNGAFTENTDIEFSSYPSDNRFTQWIDYDNDGDLDIILNGLLYRNDGNYAQAVTDINGNTYNTVTIGTQVWMKENLKTTRYNDGSQIPKVTDNNEWYGLTSPAYCWYDNDSATYRAEYGALYNWHTVNTGKLCPTGWHVPSYSEWEVLENFLGEEVAANKLKEAGNTHWLNMNSEATNSSEFTALPGGRRKSNFANQSDVGYWWSATEYNTTSAWGLFMDNHKTYVVDAYHDKMIGYSIRCLEDSTSTSLKKTSALSPIKVYPNPAKNILYIESNTKTEVAVSIFNLQGKQIFSSQVNSNSIDISYLPPGIYFTKVIAGENSSITKLIKE